MIYTMSEAKRLNKDAGFHWFDAQSMRFFACRLPKSVTPVSNGCLFVSSEANTPYPRMFSIRFVHDSGKVDTIGEFQEFETRAKANARVKQLAQYWDEYFDGNDRLKGFINE